MNEFCVCGSSKPFQACCDQYLNKHQSPRTPVQLMRSRYAAYAIGGYGDYLLQTWLPGMTQGLTAADLSLSPVTWAGLEIVDKSQQGDKGFVEFKASFVTTDGKQSVQHEKSTFQRVQGRWFYVNGEVVS